ncbi:MAG: BlaI/MecI/CopY family transcriptional regulator [bacterium]
MGTQRYVQTFRLRDRGLRRVMGSLEAEVMEEMWRQGRTTIRRVWEPLSSRRTLSFNSVMTIMNRLAEKGILIRGGRPRAHWFRPRESKDAFLTRVSKSVAEGLVQDFGDYAVAQFVAAVRDVDPQRLDALRRAVVGIKARKRVRPR